MRKLIIGIVALTIAGPVTAATLNFPPKGTYGDKQGCADYKIGTEGNYFGFDSNGKGWGGYGEMNCDIKSVKLVGKDYKIESKCTLIGAEDTPMTPTNTLRIVSPTEIIMDGEKYKKCEEPPQ